MATGKPRRRAGSDLRQQSVEVWEADFSRSVRADGFGLFEFRADRHIEARRGRQLVQTDALYTGQLKRAGDI